MNIFELVALVRRSWLLLLLATVIGAAVGFGVTLVKPDTYTATTQVYVAGVPAEGSNAVQAGEAARGEVQTYVEIATSPVVLDPVAKKVGGGASAEQLKGALKAEAPMETAIITISASDEDPERAAEIANATAAQLGGTADELSAANPGSASTVKITQLSEAAVPTEEDGSTLLYVIAGAALGFVLGYVIAVVRAVLRRGPEQVEAR